MEKGHNRLVAKLRLPGPYPAKAGDGQTDEARHKKILNSNIEIRNNIEIQMSKIRNIPECYLIKGSGSWFRILEFSSFGFVSDFDIRISNLKASALDLTAKLDINLNILAYIDI